MKNKIYQKVSKRVFMFVVLLFFLFPIMSFAQTEESFVDLGNYNLQIWDYSGDYSGYTIPDNLYTEMVMSQDSKGKLIGYGTFYLLFYDGGSSYEIPIDFDLKGTVKASNGSLTL